LDLRPESREHNPRQMNQIRVGVALWLVLFCVVCFQVTTFMRPTLWREPNAPVIEHGKLFFLDHFNQALR
jgi:hypothetical protein